jgi:EAL domain-containing protein (putative c-di-GMP-specific phosphodiesterase class I)
VRRRGRADRGRAHRGGRDADEPDLSDRILDALRARQLSHELLTVEVTETAAVDVVHAVDRLRALHDRGVSVSIDDFGTGTPLSVLPHLPVDELKVDQRFVRASLTSKADDVIVHSVRELAHRLGLEAVAEGVEDAALAERMGRAGFDRLQGCFYARPLTEAGLLSFVAGAATATPAPAPSPSPLVP